MLVEFLLQFRFGTESPAADWFTFHHREFAVPSPRVPNREIFPSDQSATCLSDKRREAGKESLVTRLVKMCLIIQTNRDIVCFEDQSWAMKFLVLIMIGCTKKDLIIISFYILKGISLSSTLIYVVITH